MKKNVIIITHHFPPEATGGASRLYELTESLMDTYNVTILCPPSTFPFTKYKKVRYLYHKEEHNRQRIVRLWTFQPSQHNPSLGIRILYYTVFPILASLFLITHLRNVTFIIISVPPSPLLITSLIARLFRKKILIDVRDLWTDVAVSLSYIRENSLILKLARKFENYCLAKSDLIITNSKIVQENLSSKLNNPNRHRIKYFPFSVNLEWFKRINEMSRKMEIVYIGNLGTAQDLNKVIEAFPLVLEKIPELKLHFYGGGDCEKQLKELVSNLKLEKNIIFDDPVPRNEIPVILCNSILGIVALSNNKAVRYALPTKTFEYFASGLPVLAYGYSDELKNVLEESGAGIYLREYSKREIADAIIKMINDKDMLEKYSINGRKFAEKNSFHSLVSDMQNLIGE